MTESGYYPAGAEYDSNAPWNQTEPESVTINVHYDCVLECEMPVETTNYEPGTWEKDEDGIGYREGDDFSSTDLLGELHTQYYTPAALISELQKIATQLAAGITPKRKPHYWKEIADNCSRYQLLDEQCEMKQS